MRGDSVERKKTAVPAVDEATNSLAAHSADEGMSSQSVMESHNEACGRSHEWNSFRYINVYIVSITQNCHWFTCERYCAGL